jgi:hypothetical protein
MYDVTLTITLSQADVADLENIKQRLSNALEVGDIRIVTPLASAVRQRLVDKIGALALAGYDTWVLVPRP